MPKVSIVVPIYKVERYIEKCARSLFEQTYSDIEYVFVDDASPDNSVKVLKSVLKEYPQRASQCVFLSHSQNKGLVSARRTGLLQATGEYVVNCDSDDWMDLTMVDKMVKEVVSNDAEVVICDFKMAFTNKEIFYKTVDWTDDKVKSLQNYIAFDWNVVWNIMFKTNLYRDYNIFVPVDISYCEDFNLSSKLLLHAKKIIHLNEPLYYYNQMNEGSIMKKMNDKTMHDEQNSYLDVIDYYKKEGVYPLYAKHLCWRILKSKQEWVLNATTYSEFLGLYPESHKYIWSCPFINLKLKIMMWSLSHKCSFIAHFMLVLRSLKQCYNLRKNRL